MTTTTLESRPATRLSWPNLLAFATPGLSIGALSVAMTVYLPRYYAGHFGLGLANVGIAFGTVRLFDTLFDSFVGIFMDRTRSRFGRYRPWLTMGAPLMMVAIYLLFTPPVAVSLIYLIGCLVIYYVANSLILLSHYAWSSSIAANYHERSRVFGTIQVVAVIGAVAVLVLPVVLTGMHLIKAGGEMVVMGAFVFCIAPLGILLALVTTADRPMQGKPPEAFRLIDYWQMASRPDMRRAIIAELCLNLGPGWMSALYLFYFHDARGFDVRQASLQLLIYVAAGVIGAGVMSGIATRLGKHRTLMAASTIYSLGLVTMAFLPVGNFLLVAVFMFAMGFVASSFVLLNRAMVADIGDAVRLDTGQNRVSLLFSMVTTAQKIALALSITLSFAVLDLIGYQAKEGAVNSPGSIFGMELVYVIGPVFFVMLGGVCFIGYKLNASRHGEIRAALEARDGA